MAVDYTKFVFDEIRRIGKAWTDTNPGHHDNEQLFEKIGDMSWRRLMDGKSVYQILEEIGVDPNDYGEPDPIPTPTPIARTGIVRASSHVAFDDMGSFHPMGITFFWGLYGWKFERDRVIEHLEWLKQFKLDYLRILAEVNWEGRSILPSWSDYETILREFVDTAYDTYGMRSEVTLVGGRYDSHRGFEEKVKNALSGAEHKVMHYEVANEWTRLDKISREDLIRVGKYLVNNTPNLVALSNPGGSYSEMIDMSKAADASMYTVHLRRSTHDNKWSNVRQGYDLKTFPKLVSNNEDQGPQSSVAELSNPLQLALQRATGIVCKGAMYVLHVGQGVTGIEDPAHNRPQNMWQVPNIDNIIKVVRGIDHLLPLELENGEVKNNSSSSHPFPLDPRIGFGFWEGDSNGAVNKNYVNIRGNKFTQILLGSKENHQGKARGNCYVTVTNPETLIVEFEAEVRKGDMLWLPVRSDTMAGYIANGEWI